MLDNLIIIHFPTGGGGKFMASCIGMSSDSTLLDLEYAYLLLEYEKYGCIQNKILEICHSKYGIIAGSSWPSLKDYIEKNYKLPDNEEIQFAHNLLNIRNLMSFVKPYQCIEELKYDMILSTIKLDNWVANEFGFQRFWGFDDQVIYTHCLTSDQIKSIELDERIREIYSAGKKLVAVTHSNYIASVLKECSKNSTVIKFVNYEKFVKLTTKHKNLDSNKKFLPAQIQDHNKVAKLYNFKKNNLSTYTAYENFIEFDVDRSMFDKRFMATELKKIYAACNISEAPNSFYLDKWVNYYMDIHQTWLAHG